MDASLYPLTPGAIVYYSAPFARDVCKKYSIAASHPVLIVSVNTALPDTEYQCMIMSSQIDKYYGYRLYINSQSPKYRGMGVVCTQKIYTIDKKYLKEILGFVTPQFLQKCRMAYGYELGIVSEVPSYYQGDEQCMAWIQAGEANIPDRPNARDLANGGVESGNKMLITSPCRPFSTAPKDITSVPIRNVDIVPFPDEDPRTIFIEDEDGENKILEAAENVEEANPNIDEGISSEPSRTTKSTENNEFNEPISEDPVKFTSSQRRVYKYRGITPKVKELVDGNKCAKIDKIDANTRNTYYGLPIDIKVNIFLRQLGPSDLRSMKIVKTFDAATALIDYTIASMINDKKKMLQDIIDHVVDLRFIGDRYISLFRVFTQADIAMIHMGVARYFEFASGLDIREEDTYIGKLIRAGLAA